MSDELLLSATESDAGETTVPGSGSFADAAENPTEVSAAPEGTDGGDQPDPAAEIKRLSDEIAGLRGGNKQQRQLYEGLKAELENARKELAEARKYQQDQLAATQQNQALFEAQQRVQNGVDAYAKTLELRGIYDEETKQFLLAEKRNDLMDKERLALDQKQVADKAARFEQANVSQQRQREAIAFRDKYVSDEAADLTEDLREVGVKDRVVTKDEILAKLTRALDDERAMDEVREVRKALRKQILDETRAALRRQNNAERDATGVDVFERGGSPSRSPQAIWDAWANGDPSISYSQAKQAEKALSRR